MLWCNSSGLVYKTLGGLFLIAAFVSLSVSPSNTAWETFPFVSLSKFPNWSFANAFIGNMKIAVASGSANTCSKNGNIYPMLLPEAVGVTMTRFSPRR